jgi:uncharacterized protein with FMN-binding domain
MKAEKGRTHAGTRAPATLMALSSAVVVAVYGAGFWKTRAAAERLEANVRRSDGLEGRSGGPGTAAPGIEAPSRSAPPAAPPAVEFTLPTAPAGDRRAPSAAVTSSVPASEPGGVHARQPRPAGAAPTPATATSPSFVPSPTTALPAQQASAPTSDAAPAASAPGNAAAVPTEAPQAAAIAEPKPPQYKDGEYLGWGSCRHGDIQAKVVITAGRITSATIAQCWTRYSCNWLDPVVPQVVQRQSPNIDYVTGATQSVDAFYWAVIDALAKAK